MKVSSIKEVIKTEFSEREIEMKEALERLFTQVKSKYYYREMEILFFGVILYAQFYVDTEYNDSEKLRN